MASFVLNILMESLYDFPQQLQDCFLTIPSFLSRARRGFKVCNLKGDDSLSDGTEDRGGRLNSRRKARWALISLSSFYKYIVKA